MAATNIVGVDPHRTTLTATLLDSRGGELGHAHVPNSRAGHAAGLAWAAEFGPADRWGIEGASGLGRQLAEFLVEAGCDVRDVPPHKTSVRGAAVTRARPIGSIPTARSSRRCRPRRTPSVSGSPCGTTPAAPSPRSASNSSGNSMRWCTISPKSCAVSSDRGRRCALG